MKPRRIYLEIQTHRANPVGILRSSFRDGHKVKHSNHGRITGLSLDQLKLLQAAFRGDVLPKDSPQAFHTISSKEYGASFALLQLLKDLGLDKALHSRNEPWVRDCMAMIVGRILYAGSKLALSKQWKNSALWELCGLQGSVDVDTHCYEPMDRLLERQKAIQRSLAKKHLRNSHLVLYDITSTYFEGDYSESHIVLFGHNRDGKKGHEQVVIGLLCNDEGCPVGVEVFAGNTQDASTVVGKVQELRSEYGSTDVTFVGDRGMVTQANTEKLKDVQGLHTISALTHRQILNLVKRDLVQPELFDEQQIVEIQDPEKPGQRYCLCRNPYSGERETQTRQRLLDRTREALNKIVARKMKGSTENLSAQVGKILQRHKMGKFVDWKVEEGRLKWNFNEAYIEQEQLFDGCYVICTDVSEEQMKTEEVVAAYKSLSRVEQAFRTLKTVLLELRPIFHKTDDRIRSHVFLCVLAYYVEWHMLRRLEPLFEGNGKGKNREWTVRSVIERLKGIRKQRVKVGELEFDQVTQADEEQKRILELLGVKM